MKCDMHWCAGQVPIKRGFGTRSTAAALHLSTCMQLSPFRILPPSRMHQDGPYRQHGMHCLRSSW